MTLNERGRRVKTRKWSEGMGKEDDHAPLHERQRNHSRHWNSTWEEKHQVAIKKPHSFMNIEEKITRRKDQRTLRGATRNHRGYGLCLHSERS
eukprot:11635749-Heterocapsa_arctica.AAC.1